MTPIRPIFYASQISACIGKNRFKTKREALEEAWKRIHSESYFDALSRNHKKSEQQTLEALVESNPHVAAAVQKSVDTTTQSSMETTAAHGNQQVSLDAITGLTAAERKLVEKTVKTNVFTGYGTRQEVNVKDILQSDHGITVVDDTKFYKKTFTTPSGNTFLVGGKIDGWTDGSETVVEIKNRVNRLFRTVYPYEAIQLQTYLQVLDKQRGLLIECYRPAKTKPEVLIHTLDRDDAMWTGEILPALHLFTDLLVGIVNDESLQDKFLSKA
jgi:hypothetical protein